MLASYYPLPVSAFTGVASCHPFSLLIHLVVYSLRYRLNMGASLVLITLVFWLTGRNNWLFFHSIMALLPMRYQLILFLSILILALYSFILREVTKRVPF